MVRVIGFIFTLMISTNLYAKTNSYFTITGDRVMINLQSGHPFSEPNDFDAVKLYEAMNIAPVNSIMGKGKKIESKSGLTIIVADRGNNQFNGTVMITAAKGVDIDFSKKAVQVRLDSNYAEEFFKYFKHTEDSFEYSSFDGKLQIYSSSLEFVLTYHE